MMTFKNFILLLLIVFLNSCISAKKYNEAISEMHTPTELNKDVNYAYEKLQKLHPNLYLYINKNELDAHFNLVKNNLNKPMSSRAFYKLLAPAITQIKQGHTVINPPFKRQTKDDLNKNGKRNYPFRSIEFKNIQNNIYVNKIFGKDSTILVGSQLLAIANKNVNDLIKQFKYIDTSDGFNKTNMPEFTRKYIGYQYIKMYGMQDSILLNFKFKDSLYATYIYAYAQKNSKKKKDNKTIKEKKINKKLAKKNLKERLKWESKYGYNKYKKEKNRSLFFIKSDSTPIIAYLNIKKFVNRNYKDFYEETFKKIDSAKSKNLIIDLRDNQGGSLNEINEFYNYLTNKEHYFVKPGKMTRSSNWYYTAFHNKSILIKSLATLFYPVIKGIQIVKVKKIDGVPYYKFNSSKLQQPKENFNYNGKIYVLINGLSFSASSILSNNLKNNQRAYFVGNETGGANNSTVAGRFANIELPNSKVRIKFGLMNLETLNKDFPDGYGVKPDKYIKVTNFDKDEQLDWIINDIKYK